jgi:hypothetical protein
MVLTQISSIEPVGAIKSSLSDLTEITAAFLPPGRERRRLSHLAANGSDFLRVRASAAARVDFPATETPNHDYRYGAMPPRCRTPYNCGVRRVGQAIRDIL